MNRLQFLKRLFFGFEIGLDVHVGGVQAFMAEPKGNHGYLDSGLQKVHRCGVANHVGRNLLGFQSGACGEAKLWLATDRGEIFLVFRVGHADKARCTAC